MDLLSSDLTSLLCFSTVHIVGSSTSRLPSIKDLNIYCEVCECSIGKSEWRGHLTTRKHGIARGDIVVEKT